MTAEPRPIEDSLNIPDSRGINLFECDAGLAALLQVYLPSAVYQQWLPTLQRLGARAGGELDVLALSADKNPPVLQPRTRRGENLQSIAKHPDYVTLERVAFAELGLAAMSHQPGGPPPLIKYALTYLFVQAEFGLCCPVSMTDSLTRTLCKFGTPELVARYLPQLQSQEFETLFQGAMFMTEQAAGSDVSRTETRARLEDGQWRLFGEKWFCSNPDADLAMVLARPEDAPPGMAGVTLFLLPKVLPDGSRNHYRIQRLKDKLGSRSMASGEITLEGATACLIGEVGRGFQQMADMINMSRLSNGVRAAGLMRRGLSEALYIARQRRAFGKHLIEMPLMQRQLLKMMLPTEQARSMFMQIASLLPRADGGDETARKCVRILTPLIKFRACRDARRVTGDAMEVRGGVGYIRGVERCPAGARCAPGVDLGGHQQHRRPGHCPGGDSGAGAGAVAGLSGRAAGRGRFATGEPPAVRFGPVAHRDRLPCRGAAAPGRAGTAGGQRSLSPGQRHLHGLGGRAPGCGPSAPGPGSPGAGAQGIAARSVGPGAGDRCRAAGAPGQ
nr:acyl-CoA dehydrogenase family protein [Pseudomonas protegens]